jgi:hypothetical protein
VCHRARMCDDDISFDCFLVEDEISFKDARLNGCEICIFTDIWPMNTVDAVELDV